MGPPLRYKPLLIFAVSNFFKSRPHGPSSFRSFGAATARCADDGLPQRSVYHRSGRNKASTIPFCRARALGFFAAPASHSTPQLRVIDRPWYGHTSSCNKSSPARSWATPTSQRGSSTVSATFAMKMAGQRGAGAGRSQGQQTSSSDSYSTS